MSDDFIPPRGTLDWLPARQAARHAMLDRFRAICEGSGYAEVATPVFEEKALFWNNCINRFNCNRRNNRLYWRNSRKDKFWSTVDQTKIGDTQIYFFISIRINTFYFIFLKSECNWI